MPFIQLAHCTHQACVLPLCHQINKSCELKMVSFIWCVCADRLHSEKMWLLLFTIFIYSLHMQGGSVGFPDNLGCGRCWLNSEFHKNLCAKKNLQLPEGLLAFTYITFRLRVCGMINLCLLSFILFSKGKIAHSEDLFALFSYTWLFECTLFCITSSVALKWNLFRRYSCVCVLLCMKPYPAPFIIN